MTSTTNLPIILKTRLLVGYLGERAQHAWWSTSFYGSSSRLFLEPVFAKTSQLCQYHGVLEAARRLHDEHLSVGSYHLFRLPEEIEQDLYSLVQRHETDEFVIQELSSKEAALNSLKDLAGAGSVKIVGPTLVGNIGELDSPNTVQTMVAAYLWAFSQDAKTYPYLAG